MSLRHLKFHNKNFMYKCKNQVLIIESNFKMITSEQLKEKLKSIKTTPKLPFFNLLNQTGHLFVMIYEFNHEQLSIDNKIEIVELALEIMPEIIAYIGHFTSYQFYKRYMQEPYTCNDVYSGIRKLREAYFQAIVDDVDIYLKKRIMLALETIDINKINECMVLGVKFESMNKFI